MPTEIKRKWAGAPVVETSHIPPDPEVTLNYGNSIANYQRIVRDGPVPGYKILIRQGVSATSFLSATGRITRLLARGNHKAKITWILGGSPDETYPRTFTKQGWTTSPFIPWNNPSDISPGEVTTDVENQAIRRFLNKVQQAQTQIQAIVAGGELAKSIKTINSASGQLQSLTYGHLLSLGKAKKGFKNASKKKKRDYLSERWLEFQYGIKPLVSDIKGLSEAAARSVTGTFLNAIRVQAGAHGSSKSTVMNDDGDSMQGKSEYWDWYLDESHDVKYYGTVKVTVDPLGAGAQSLGLTWGNFLPSLWELVPYSFLVDYFTNVGDVIEAVSMPSASVGWVNRGALSKLTYTMGNRRSQPWEQPNPLILNYDIELAPAMLEDVFFHKVRTGVQGIPLPTLSFRLPKTKTQWANIAALAITHRKLLPF